jgi:ribosomal protein S15P/S13E
MLGIQSARGGRATTGGSRSVGADIESGNLDRRAYLLQAHVESSRTDPAERRRLLRSLGRRINAFHWEDMERYLTDHENVLKEFAEAIIRLDSS